jgi:hypothetical protein
MKKLIYLMLSLTFLAACSPGGGPGTGGGANSNNTQKTVTIQGKTPTEYYNQFLFVDSKDCGIDDWYRYPSVWNISLLDKVNGHDTAGTLRVYLYKNGTFFAEYDSDEHTPGPSPGIVQTSPVLRETVSDRWSVTEDGEILLGALGRGTSLIYNDMPAINLVLGSFFADKGVRYSDVVLTMNYSSHGKRNNPSCPRSFSGL